MRQRYLLFVLAGILMAGCGDPNTPPFELISEESKLPVSPTDSVEYYQLSERDVWDFGQRTPFRTILYFDNQAYETILQQVKQDASYSELTDENQKQKVYDTFLKKNLNPPPKCQLGQPMYVYHAQKSGSTIFCNRIHFRYGNLSPFD